MIVELMELQRWFGVPLRDRKWWVKNLIGGLFSAFPVVGWLAGGYQVEVVKTTLRGSTAMPEWGDWLTKFVNGFLMSLIQIVYLFIPLVIGAVRSGSLGMSPLSSGPGSILGHSMSAVVLAVVLGALVPFATVRFAETGSLMAAFQVGNVVRSIGNVLRPYLVVYGSFLVVTWLAGRVLTGIFGGALLLSFVNFYLHVAFSAAFAELYIQAKRLPDQMGE